MEVLYLQVLGGILSSSLEGRGILNGDNCQCWLLWNVFWNRRLIHSPQWENSHTASFDSRMSFFSRDKQVCLARAD